MLLKTLINANELALLLGQPNVVVLDCRFYLTNHAKGKLEYDKSHIPGAVFVDVHHQLAAPETELTGRHPLPDETVFSEQLQSWGIDSNSQVVVYDDMGGAIAARAWWMLSQQNIDVCVLNGGFPEWLKQGKEVSMTSVMSTAASNKIAVSFPWAISEQAIVENFETNQFQLVDARAADRFNGENETMDPVAGHIPGAINRPYSDNLDSDACFKPAEQLHVEWQDWLSGRCDGYVYYCGSGVTACHNVLALNYAGIEARQVYVGSWSQWSKRMLRAIAL
ncbi:sulfurtransferase [Marinomonas rhizomae]|uniref:Thiosulfate/3-mercaptopyruvate sulfurtransferase n=1 Tax=Marinomonas rhizomae TaxID=491948 RepID=A0A366J3X3_9GAMM|nr:sulfurtransferase [Marinomonas rhizomae]RBP81736.1 thiosulfate/3-mercaptopyruvate sulfurtransferase [Marinomonas rhizomae]RNF72864.1 sulfurtransferase [Marinomonas rhizomae]